MSGRIIKYVPMLNICMLSIYVRINLKVQTVAKPGVEDIPDHLPEDSACLHQGCGEEKSLPELERKTGAVIYHQERSCLPSHTAQLGVIEHLLTSPDVWNIR